MKEKEKEHELELQEQRNNQAKLNEFYNSRAALSSNQSAGDDRGGGRGGGRGKKMKYEDYDNEEEEPS